MQPDAQAPKKVQWWSTRSLLGMHGYMLRYSCAKWGGCGKTVLDLCQRKTEGYICITLTFWGLGHFCIFSGLQKGSVLSVFLAPTSPTTLKQVQTVWAVVADWCTRGIDYPERIIFHRSTVKDLAWRSLFSSLEAEKRSAPWLHVLPWVLRINYVDSYVASLKPNDGICPSMGT